MQFGDLRKKEKHSRMTDYFLILGTYANYIKGPCFQENKKAINMFLKYLGVLILLYNIHCPI